MECAADQGPAQVLPDTAPTYPRSPLSKNHQFSSTPAPFRFPFFFFFHSVTFHHVNFQPMAPATFSRCHLSAVAPFYLNLIFPHQRDDLHFWVELTVEYGWKSCVVNVYTFDYIVCVCVWTVTPDVATAVCSPVATFAKVELIHLVVLKKRMSQMSLWWGQTNIVHCYCVFRSGAICATQWWKVVWRFNPFAWSNASLVVFFHQLFREKHNTDATAVVLIRSDAATLSKCAPCKIKTP